MLRCQDAPVVLPGPVDFASLGLLAFLEDRKQLLKQIRMYL